jgi:hypothetical protein
MRDPRSRFFFMHHERSRTGRRVALHPSCETLEGRALLSGLDIPASVQSALLHGIGSHAIKTEPAGISAITSALGGGPGSEFVNLIKKEVRNPAALLGKFTSGATTSATIPGAAARKATILPTFIGGHYDYQAIVATGALLLPTGTLELGSILRGPNRSTADAYYVYGIDTGSGSTLGPLFASRPGITPNDLVTITLGPNNTNPTGTITDLATGSVTTLSPSTIQAVGSTLRVYVPTTQLPSTGVPVSQYHFAFWTQSQPGDNIANVGSFLPDSTMIPIGTSDGKGLKL